MPRPKRSKVAPSHGASRPSHSRGVASTSEDISSATNDRHAQALESLKRKRDEAMQRLEAENYPSTTAASSEQPIPATSDNRSSSPAIEFGRRERPASMVEDPLFANGPFRRRARQSSILGKRMSRARSSSVEVDAQDDIGAKVEGSVLRQGGFRRRERQPSILGRRGRSSSVGQDTENDMASNSESAMKSGRFGRRSRQPSILGTASKHRRPGGGMYDDTEDFNPDDESTPLKLQKSKSTTETSSHPESSATSRKRKMSPIEISSPTPSEDDIATDDPSSPPQQVQQRTQTPDILSEIMAPPQSSSPTAPSPSPLRPSRRTNIQPRARAPAPGTRKQPSRNAANDDPPSSPPSLTFSPNQPANPSTRQAKPKPQPASFSTADLQTLLPRRRRRPVHDSFEMLSSEEEDGDQDELSHIGTTRSTRRTPAPTKRVTKLKSAAKSATKGKRTYGTRQTTSDKENESGTDDEFENEDGDDADDSLGPMRDVSPENSQELEAKIGKELKDAKRKFEDVDKWELDFEEITASSSSPADAR